MDALYVLLSVNHGVAAECCVLCAACRQNNTPEMKMQWAQYNAAVLARKPHFPWLEVLRIMQNVLSDDRDRPT